MKRILIAAVTLVAVSAFAQQTAEQRIGGWLKQMDKNGDKALSREETKGLMLKFFDRNDADKDGTLDPKELEALADRLSKNQRSRTPQPAVSTDAFLKDVPEGVVVEPDITYREGDSERFKLDLFRPKDRGDEPRPGIVFVHGGGWRNGDKRKGLFGGQAKDYAAKGYVCISVNYRLINEAPFPACVEDVKCAVRWFRANAEEYNLDPDHIGGYGNSAGAHLVSMLGLVKKDAGLEGDGPHLDQSSLIQAVCASAPPTDFRLFGERMMRNGGKGGLLEGPPETVEARAKKASPITYATADAPPFLVIHGTKDSTVAVAHGDTFVEALKKAGAKDLEYLRIEGAGHGVFGQHGNKTKPAMEAFFKKHLMDK